MLFFIYFYNFFCLSRRVAFLADPSSHPVQVLPTSVMEETDALFNKGDAQLISGVEDSLIILTATGCRDVFGS